MSQRQVLLVLALVFVAFGVFMGNRSLSSADTDCGSVFSPDSFESGIADGISGDDSASTGCGAKISDGKPVAYGALGLGGIALIAAVLVPSKPSEQRPVA